MADEKADAPLPTLQLPIMVASFVTEEGTPPHVIQWAGDVGKVLPKVQTRAYCGETKPTIDGVWYLPANAPFCKACKLAVLAAEKTYADAQAKANG